MGLFGSPVATYSPTAPSVTNASAADTQLSSAYATIVTKTLTPLSGNVCVKVTYTSCYFNGGGALTGNEAVGRVKLITNANGGGDVDHEVLEIQREKTYGFQTFVWILTGLAAVSTVFTIKEKCDNTAGGPLYNASGAGNSATPAKLIIEQY